MRWFFLHVLAVLRGRKYRWPCQPPVPRGYSGVSCGLKNWRESRTMFKHGWIPWGVQRTTDGAVSRTFIIKEDHTPGIIDRLEEEEWLDLWGED